jgi:hypothetical protein
MVTRLSRMFDAAVAWAILGLLYLIDRPTGWLDLKGPTALPRTRSNGRPIWYSKSNTRDP